MYNLFELRDFQRYFQIIIMQISKYLVNMAMSGIGTKWGNFCTGQNGKTLDCCVGDSSAIPSSSIFFFTISKFDRVLPKVNEILPSLC